MRDPSPYFKGFVLGLFLGLSLLSCAHYALAADDFDLERVTVLTTGEDRTIRWCNPTGQTDSEWTVTVQVLEFPPKENQLPSSEFVFDGTQDSTIWTPSRAGAYYVRANSCSETDGCSPWAISVELQTGQEGCSTVPQKFIYYVKLAAPTGGGIE